MEGGHLSRRRFLKSSTLAVATAFSLSLTRPLFSEQATKPERRLHWGIIGTGARGSKHIPALKSFPDFEVLAACDVMENHLNHARQQIGNACQPYSDYQKLLSNPDINAVMIATPNCWHKEIVLAALQAGKHVVCEKPMAATWDECKAIQSAVAAASQTVLFTMQLRYSPHYAMLRQQIVSGKIGQPRYLLMAEFRGDWNRGDVWQYTDPRTGKSMNWRFSHAASGGTLSEKVCHYFDILAWMVGANPTSVKCDGGIAVYNDGRDTWDHATTLLTYPNTIKATHSLCMFGPKRLDLEIIGTEGALKVSEDSPNIILQSRGKREEIKTPDEVVHGERGSAKGQETAVLKMYEDFIDCVKNNKKPWMSPDKAMASSKTAWLGELSSERKQEIQWNDLT